LQNLIINQINRIIDFDTNLGRGKENFFADDYNAITKSIDEFQKQGFRVFIGGGNIFILKVENRLTGYTATCLQMRGMARRKIIIKEAI
jgi:hypothetical protein